MADQNRTVRTIIGYSYDAASGKVVTTGVASVNAALQQTITLTKELQTNDQKPLVGLLNYAKSAGILKEGLQVADAQIEDMSSDLLTLEENARKAGDGLEGLSKKRVKPADFPTFSDQELGFSGGGGDGRSPGGLSAFGSKIRSLPSVQIPGAGFGTDAIGNVLRVIGAIPAAAIPAVAAIGGLTAAILVVNKTVPDLTSGIRDIIGLDKQYYEARIKGTKDSIAAIIDQKKLEQQIAQARVDDLSFVAKGYDELNNKLGSGLKGFTTGVIEVAGALGASNFKDIRDARIEYDKAQEELKKANKELTLYNGLIDNQAVALNTAAEAQKAAIEAGIDRTIKQAGDQAKLEVEIATLKREGSAKELEDLKKKAEADKETALINANIIGEQIKNAKEGSVEQQKFQAEFAKQINAYNDASDRLSALGDSALEAAVKLNDANEAAKKIRDEEASAVLKFNDDVKALNEKKAQDELNLYNSLIDKQVGIANKAVEDAQKAYDSLVAKQGSLQTNLDRALEDQDRRAAFDSLQRQIKFGRQEVEQENKTQQQILKIQEDAKNKEFELGIDRNFAQLAASRRATNQQLAQVNQDANNDRAARLKKFQDDNTDQQSAFAFDRENKIRKYQQDLADAQAAEQTQLQAIQIEKQKQLGAAISAYNKEYQAIQSKYANELAARQAAIVAELKLIAGGEQAKNTLLQQAYQQAQNIIRGVFGLGGASPAAGGSVVTPRIVATRAAGGSLFNGQVSTVNEPWSTGRESYTNKQGQTMVFPGYGIFQSLGGGTVNRGGGDGASINLSMPITVQGVDGNAVLKQAGQMADERIAYAIRLMNRRTA